MNCIRCEVELTEEEVIHQDGEDYCENCYADLFVSWQEAYESAR